MSARGGMFLFYCIYDLNKPYAIYCISVTIRTGIHHTRQHLTDLGECAVTHFIGTRPYAEPFAKVVVGWLLNVPGASWCISGTDMLRQLYVLPHSNRSCGSNFLLHPVTYTDTGPTSPSDGRIMLGAWQDSLEVLLFFKSLVSLEPKIPTVQAGIEPRICRSRGGRLNH